MEGKPIISLMPENNNAKVVITMSGGVDSSVAALLLKEQGYQVCGISMKIWDGTSSSVNTRHHSCYGPGEEEDMEDAARVARKLGIDFHVFDLSREFKAEVLDYFYNEYLEGRTPNPCLRCNKSIKFDALLKKAEKSGIKYDYFASGHYARVEYSESRQRYLIRKARDLKKDQSYFLSFLTQDQLCRMILPLSNYTKEEVKKIASGSRLGLSHKQESRDFVYGSYHSLMGETRPGPLLNKYGEKIGEHRGIQFYTIGQRRGIGVASGRPQYVIDIDREKNAVIIGSREELYRNEFTASGLNWIAINELKEELLAKARIRYRHNESESIVKPVKENMVRVKFREPQMAITPGQTVAFYEEDILIGGGTIEKATGV